LALGAINPLLALAATIETGPGEDANCAGILRQAASPPPAGQAQAVAGAQKGSATLGGPGTRAKSLLGGRASKEAAHPPPSDATATHAAPVPAQADTR
jgi:hypothetical protein